MKKEMVDSAIEVCNSLKLGENNPQNVWGNMVNATVERKEWQRRKYWVLAREVAKGRYIEVSKEDK